MALGLKSKGAVVHLVSSAYSISAEIRKAISMTILQTISRR